MHAIDRVFASLLDEVDGVGDVLRRNLVPLDRRFGSMATNISVPAASAAAAWSSEAWRSRAFKVANCARPFAASSPLSLRALVDGAPVFQSPSADRDRLDKLQIAGQAAAEAPGPC